MIPKHIQEAIEKEAVKEEIYEPKYGGKDHSGYSTMMLYEVNSERSECFQKGAEYGYSLAQQEREWIDVILAELEAKENELLKQCWFYDLHNRERHANMKYCLAMVRIHIKENLPQPPKARKEGEE
jgi:hypothetical protein